MQERAFPRGGERQHGVLQAEEPGRVGAWSVRRKLAAVGPGADRGAGRALPPGAHPSAGPGRAAAAQGARAGVGDWAVSDPHTYPRRVLLAVTGLSPQIVTETLYALAHREPAVVPTEIRLVTTLEGAERARLTLLDPEDGQFHALCRDYGLVGIRFDAGCRSEE